MNNKENASQVELLDIFSRFSHDIKNMLSTMYANYQLAEMKEPKLMESPYWKRFKTTIRDLNSYVDRTSLLRYSYRYNPSEFDICDLLYALPDLCEELLPDADRSIEFDFNVDSYTINADYDMISSALTELLANAYEATKDGDTITIQLRILPNQLNVIIANPGTTGNITEKLFEPYFTTKDNHLGIGLAIARNVANTHNGTIKMESVANRTELQFQFPL